MKTKTAKLKDKALDYAVLKALGQDFTGFDLRFMDAYPYSTDWSWGGPIIEREKVEITAWGHNEWRARSNWNAGYATWVHVTMFETFGPTPLTAAMRCYVASKLGEEVDIPEELCTKS